MSAALSESDLAWMREMEESAMGRLCTITDAQATSASATGGKVKGTATVHAAVRCGVKSLKGAERQTGEGTNAFADYEVVMPLEVGGSANLVSPKHVLAVAEDAPEPALTLEVVIVLYGRTALRCLTVLKN